MPVGTRYTGRLPQQTGSMWGKSTATAFTDKSAVFGVKYTYTIRVLRDGFISSPYANGIARTYVAAPKISEITGKNSDINLKWTMSESASGYVIEYTTASSMSKAKTKKVTSVDKFAKNLTKLAKDKKYYVRIRAYKKSGSGTVYSAWSSVKPVKTRK